MNDSQSALERHSTKRKWSKRLLQGGSIAMVFLVSGTLGSMWQIESLLGPDPTRIPFYWALRNCPEHLACEERLLPSVLAIERSREPAIVASRPLLRLMLLGALAKSTSDERRRDEIWADAERVCWAAEALKCSRGELSAWIEKMLHGEHGSCPCENEYSFQ